MGELNRLARLLDGRVSFEGLVVGGAASEVPAYRKVLGCAFSLRLDSQGMAAAKAGAVCSLDLVLRDGAGKAIRLWEGIGQVTVEDLTRELARRGVPLPAPVGFSEITQTGCRLGVCYPLKAVATQRQGMGRSVGNGMARDSSRR